MKEKRKVIDCRCCPSDSKCTLSISGTEEEVLKAATEHAVSSHGEKNTLELKEKIRKMMKDEN
jgi:predicted small metal-binding protein